MDSSYYVNQSYGVSNTSGLTGIIAGLGIFAWIFSLAIAVLMLVSMWKLFVKAGKPGWASLIPIYNIVIMCEIAEKPVWYIILLFVPIANIYASFMIYDGIAKKFGKSSGFAIGMLLLPIIFIPILGLGKDALEMSNEASTNTNSVEEPTPDASQPITPEAVPAAPEVTPTDVQSYEAPVFDNTVAPEAAPIAPEPAPIAPEPAPVVPEPAPIAPEPAPVAPEPTPTQPEAADPQKVQPEKHTSMWTNNSNTNE